MDSGGNRAGTRLLERPEGATVLLRKASLEGIDDASAGTVVSIDRTCFRVGTDPANDLVLDDDAVSGRHFEIVADERGHRLRDAGSRNGTFVDGARAVDVYLRPGCEISAGRTRLRFSLGSGDVAIPLSRRTDLGGLLGHSPAMRAAFALLERAAKTDATVLVVGESGTGKELAARAVHDHSSRRDGPYVVFDCGAAAPTLLESHLFGHARGAFTGAVEAQAGAFESADKGTLVLDEIGELPLDLQPRLLRALEAHSVQRLGETSPRTVDVRFVACTNRNLEAEVRAGRFREDLWFRLSVITVRMPPLRERREEIPRLARHFLEKLAGTEAPPLPQPVVDLLMGHSWPGNVRELRNFVERFAVLPEADPAAHLRDGAPRTSPADAAGPRVAFERPFHEAKERWLDEFERSYLARLLEAHRGNVSEAARTAGLSRQTCYRLMEKHGLRGQ